GLQADWGYSTKALDQWRQKTGSQDAPKPNDPVWGDMRRESLDKALFLMQRAAKQARPGILVAAFGLGEGSVPSTVEDFSSSKVYTGALQNWPKWMKEKTTDLIVLENYRVDEQDNAAFDAWNAFAAALVKQTQVEVLSGIAGSANVSMGVLAQLHRTHELGLMGVVVSNYREPIQDAGSREIFFRALNAGVLSADSRRAPLKEVQLASVKTDDALPIPPPPEPAKMDQERPVEEVIDEIIKQGPKPPEGKYTELIKPSDEAVTYLRRMFSNIFN
ncbi:family 10 glycosylhydrolase, partial [Candidatus Sumerlaeota bacterium]|nr:family 10 glycosylhydrolase [Candidatus Sumerlaeota bacterium]